MSNMSIAIVGNGFTVSQKCEALIEQEFPGVRVLRMAGVEEVLAHKGAPLQLLLIEQEALSGFGDEELTRLLDAPVERMALAYLDEAVALRALDQIHDHSVFAKFCFLPMNLQFDCWASMLRLAFLGQCCVPQAFLFRHAEQPGGLTAKQQALKCTAKLTPREHEILELAASGKQNKLIAVALDLSEHTVKLHMHHIITKLGVRNRTEAAGVFLGQSQ